MVVNRPSTEDQIPKKNGLIIIVLAISLIPLLLFGNVILYEFEEAYHTKIFDHLTALVRKHSRSIDDFLVDRLGDIRVLARSHSKDDLMDQNFLHTQLTILRDEYRGVFVDLGMIDPNGIQQLYSGPFNLVKANYAGTRWFSEAQKSEHFISDVFTGLRGTPHFIVAVKVMIEDEEWMLRATVDFEAFNALVSSIRIGETGFAFILNHEGDFQTKPEINVSLNHGPYMDFLKSRPGSGKVIITEGLDGSGREAIFVVNSLKNGQWILIFQQESADTFAALNMAKITGLVLFLLSAVVVAFGALFLSKGMTRRFTEILAEKENMGHQVIEAGRLASIGELAAGIAHEINNPVAIMVEEAGWIQDLLAEDDPATEENLTEIQQAAAQIRTQGSRCKEITQKLLSFARKTDPITREIEINELIEDVVSLVEQKTRYANVKVKMDLDPNLPPIVASATELQQVLLNLLNNSIHAVDHSGGNINLRTQYEAGKILLEVADDGIGIAEANLPRIFDPFYTTKPVGVGTGLGLSICYGIIKKLGGDISVQSAKQQGTTFTITLPAVENPENDDSCQSDLKESN